MNQLQEHLFRIEPVPPFWCILSTKGTLKMNEKINTEEMSNDHKSKKNLQDLPPNLRDAVRTVAVGVRRQLAAKRHGSSACVKT